MIIIGLTGGIGSGKSTVGKILESLGIPVYNADNQAKYLMNHNESLKRKIIQLLGTNAYTSEGLNRKWIATQVFENEEKLEKLNQLVHPAVAEDFSQWALKQKALYVVREAAILLESNSYHDCDAIILVTADETIRIERVKQRNHWSEAEIRNRMQHQMPEKDKEKYCKYIITNNGYEEELIEKVKLIHNQILTDF